MKLSNYQSALVTILTVEGFSAANSSPSFRGRRFRHSTITGLSASVCCIEGIRRFDGEIVVFLEDFTGFVRRIVFSDRKQLRLDLEKAMLEYGMYRL